LLGAALAATWRGWLTPAPRLARALLAASSAAFAGVLALTAFLLAPVPPAGPLYGQWGPHRSYFDPFTGRIERVQINGLPVPAWEMTDPEAYRRAYLNDPVLARAEIVTGRPTRFGTTTIARLVAAEDEMFAFAQRRAKFVFRFRVRSADFRVRTLSLGIADALAVEGEAIALEGGRRGRTMFVRVVRATGTETTAVNLGSSLGWTLFLPFDLPLGPWHQPISDLWLACLAVPLGFYAAASTRRTDEPSPRRGLVLALPLAAVIVGLGVVPSLAEFSPAHWSEWAGAAAGLIAGAALWRQPTRRS
jgi:hypothetical protein